MMRRQQVHKNHTHIYISLILKVIRLSSKDAELQSRQITWRLRQRAASNAPVVREINEALRKEHLENNDWQWWSHKSCTKEKNSVSGKIYTTENTVKERKNIESECGTKEFKTLLNGIKWVDPHFKPKTNINQTWIKSFKIWLYIFPQTYNPCLFFVKIMFRLCELGKASSDHVAKTLNCLYAMSQ